MAFATASRSTATSSPRVDAARTGITRNTEGRATEVENDPRLRDAMDHFARVMAGGGLPFSDASKGAMMSQHAASAAGQQAAQLRALQDATAAAGGSIYDPSFQAKAAELNAMRQGQVVDQQGKIEAEAATANHAAQQAAAANLANVRTAQNAQVNQMRGLAAEHQGRTFDEQSTGQQPGGIAGGELRPDGYRRGGIMDVFGNRQTGAPNVRDRRGNLTF